MNNEERRLLNNAAARKAAEAQEKFLKLPVSMCSKGNLTWLPVQVFKREGAITSSSGTEEYTPVNTHLCPVCQKLIPFAEQLGSIPDIFISDCKMTNTQDPQLLQILCPSVPIPEKLTLLERIRRTFSKPVER